jgi:release factor glutamine methyltransferase
LDAELLIGSGLSMSRLNLYLKFDQPLSEPEIKRCRDLVRRRGLGEPVAYILGQRSFYNLDFKVDARVLIPRPETELLVEESLAYFKSPKFLSWRQDSVLPIEILDMGCGSGCIGLSVVKNQANSTASLIDQSSAALEVAKINAKDLELLDRVHFIEVDCAEFKSEKKFDLVLANPPYIAKDDPLVEKHVAQFEPASALFADEDGMKEITAWAKIAAQVLAAEGLCLFEIGFRQAQQSVEIFKNCGFQKIEVLKDLSGHDRVIKARLFDASQKGEN